MKSIKGKKETIRPFAGFKACILASIELNDILHQIKMQDIQEDHEREMFRQEESHRMHVTVLYACKEANRKFRNMELSIN